MATTRPEKPEKRLRKKKKLPKKFKLSYSLLLLIGMIFVGSVAGLVAYRFGKQALEGVNPSPAGIKLPKVSPPPKPKDSPKSSQNSKTSLLLDESEILAEVKARSQQEIGTLTRPNYVAKANVSDRKRIYTRVERTYNAMRDPLAVSANSDERIAESIATLRQRVYSRSRIYERDTALNRPIANNVNTSDTNLLSTPVEIEPIRSRWQDRDEELAKSRQVSDMDVLPKPTSSFFIIERQSPTPVNVNQR